MPCGRRSEAARRDDHAGRRPAGVLAEGPRRLLAAAAAAAVVRQVDVPEPDPRARVAPAAVEPHRHRRRRRPRDSLVLHVADLHPRTLLIISHGARSAHMHRAPSSSNKLGLDFFKKTFSILKINSLKNLLTTSEAWHGVVKQHCHTDLFGVTMLVDYACLTGVATLFSHATLADVARQNYHANL